MDPNESPHTEEGLEAMRARGAELDKQAAELEKTLDEKESQLEAQQTIFKNYVETFILSQKMKVRKNIIARAMSKFAAAVSPVFADFEPEIKASLDKLASLSHVPDQDLIAEARELDKLFPEDTPPDDLVPVIKTDFEGAVKQGIEAVKQDLHAAKNQA